MNRKGCELKKNAMGLYDLTMYDDNGNLVVDLKNVTFSRAVCEIEGRMYINHATFD